MKKAYSLTSKTTFKHLLRFLISLVVALLLATWAFNQSNLSEFTFKDINTILSSISWKQIIILVFIVIATQGVRAWRITWIFYYTYGNFFRTFFTVFFFTNLSFLLGGIGFLMRLFIFKKKIRSSYLITLSVISMEKIIDFIIAFVLFFFLFTVPNTTNNSIFSLINEYKNWILIPILTGIVLLLFHYRTAIKYLLCLIYQTIRLLGLPQRYYLFFKKQLFYLYKSLSSIGKTKLLRFLFHSFIIFTLESLFLYLGLHFFKINLPFSYSFLVNATIVLALLIPLLPSGFGLFQAALVLTVSVLVKDQITVSFDTENIFYVALLIHFLLIMVNLVILTIGTYIFSNSFNIFKLIRNFQK